MPNKYYVVRIFTKDAQLYHEQILTIGPYETMGKDKVFSLITEMPPEELLPLYYQTEDADKINGSFTEDQLKKLFRERKYEEKEETK